jgi:hypothetical protein
VSESLEIAGPSLNESTRQFVPDRQPVESYEVSAPSPSADVASEAAPEPASNPAMQAVAERASELTRHGFSLAKRRAWYSARSEFVQALRLISQALDTQAKQNVHSLALARGLRALEEADDFVPKGSRLEADLNVAAIVLSHETPVLKSAANQATPLVAVQRYYTYA